MLDGPSLTSLNFSVTDETAYRWLIDNPATTVDELSRACGMAPRAAADVVARLEHRRLVTVVNDVLDVVDPQAALALLAASARGHAVEALERAAAVFGTITSLAHRYAESRHDEAAVEVSRSPECTRTLIVSISGQTSESVRNMQRRAVAPEAMGPGQRLTAGALNRGVAVRSLYSPAALASDHHREAVRPLRRLGDQVRCGPTPFERLLISDVDVALIKPARESAVNAFVVRNPALVSTLADVFDYCWASAHEVPEQGASVSARQLEILRELAAGGTDTSISRECGISVRQVARDVAELMARTKTSTRFALGVEAVRLGWI